MNDESLRDLLIAARLFARQPNAFGGLVVRAHAGPVRQRYLDIVRQHRPAESPWRRLPLSIEDERLLGGLDLAATLAGNRPVLSRGLLTEADGGVIVISMAERMSMGLAARLAAVMDRGVVQIARDGLIAETPARFGLILLDEGLDDESIAVELADRCAFHVTLDGLSLTRLDAMNALLNEVAQAAAMQGSHCAYPSGHPDIALTDDVMRALCATAMSLGIASARTDLFACRCALRAACWAGHHTIEADDTTLAARLVLAPRALRWPEQSTDEEPAPEPPPEDPPPPGNQADQEEAQSQQTPDGQLDDVVLEAARSAISPGVLELLLADPGLRLRSAGSGRRGVLRKSGLRGRPAGVRPGRPGGQARLSLIETLRAAAPWQRLRGSASASRIAVRVDDFRVRRFKDKSETTTVFLVDASGSSAVHRLAEAKGAVELLLADCYVRRDQVAVIAFRGRQAEVILPPTRSLVRAKKSLAGLPGGGGTPLASALDAALALVGSIARRGGTPAVVVLTDGRANIARDGQPGREKAQADALNAARQFALTGFPSMVIDTSTQPSVAARTLAESMRARYLPLPHAGAEQVSTAVRLMAR
jgi:magnesium chelatase subunit D